MIKTSIGFKRKLADDDRHYILLANVTLKDQTGLVFTNSMIWSGGFSIDDAVSKDSELEIGSAIINTGKLIINNIYDTYSDYDFTDARVVLFVGLEVDGDEELLQKGVYTVDEASYNGSVITLTLMDNMRKFDIDYSNSTLQYPATLGDIINDACSACGVLFSPLEASLPFPHYEYVVENKPEKEGITFREVVSYVAQIAGCYARCNRYGYLQIRWFNQNLLDWSRGGKDGGIFDSDTPYSTGDNVDGGSFRPWNVGDVVDAEDFEKYEELHFITSTYSHDISVDDVVITGIRIEVEDDEAEAEEDKLKVFVAGEEGYMISISDNPFITVDNAQQIADWLATGYEYLPFSGPGLVGLTYRKADVNHLSDPSIEAGDIAIVWDRKDNNYPVLITRTTFTSGNSQKSISAAETPLRKSAARYNQNTKAWLENQEKFVYEKSERQKMYESLTEMIANSSGLYETREQQPGGGEIIYYHNKPRKEDSDIIWRLSSEVWSASTDGGKTWNVIISATGEAIVNRISALWADFEWTQTGVLRVFKKDAQGRETNTLWVNASTGEVRIVADSFSLTSGDSLEKIRDDLSDTIAEVDVQYASGTSSTTAPTSGWSTTAPTWQSGRYIWQRTKTTDGNGNVSYSTPTCIQGAKGDSGSPGSDGRGVSAIEEQYYLSNSSTTQTGGSWSTAQPAWSQGKYIWTRSKVTWTSGSITYTSPVLAKAINGANEKAYDAEQAAIDAEQNAKDYADTLQNLRETSSARLQDQRTLFSRLTNNGTSQGIFLQNGEIYINAALIAANQLMVNGIPLAGRDISDDVSWTVGTYDAMYNRSEYIEGFNISVIEFPYTVEVFLTFKVKKALNGPSRNEGINIFGFPECARVCMSSHMLLSRGTRTSTDNGIRTLLLSARDGYSYYTSAYEGLEANYTYEGHHSYIKSE